MKRVISVFLAALLVFSAAPLFGSAVDVDTAPPEIHLDTLQLTLPEGKETVTIGDTVKLSVQVTDDNPITLADAYYRNPETNRDMMLSLKYNEATAKYELEYTVDNNTASGEWVLSRLHASDANENHIYLFSTQYTTTPPNADLSACNFTVTGTTADVTPPEFHIDTLSLTLPEGKETVTVGDTVKLSVQITDDNPITLADAYYRNPETNRDMMLSLKYNEATAKYELEYTVDNNTASGEWVLSRLHASDANENHIYLFSTQYTTTPPNADLSACNFTVTGTTADVTPPEFHIDTLALTLPEGKETVIIGNTVKLSVQITDDSSITLVDAYYRNPETNRDMVLRLKYNEATDRYEFEYAVTENTAPGEWVLSRLHASDANNNHMYFYSTQYANNTPNADLSAGNFTVAETCLVTFDFRGGSEVAPVYVEKGTCVPEPQDPTREGYFFSCWCSDPEDPYGFSFYRPIEDDITLYGVWASSLSLTDWNALTGRADGIAGKYAFTSSAWGTTPETLTGDDYSYGCSNYALPEGCEVAVCAKANPGYVFDGWYRGVYTGNAQGQSAEPLDLTDPANLLSADPVYSFTAAEGRTVVAVFKECPGHNWVEDSRDAPTCTEFGVSYQICTVCNLKQMELLSPLGHMMLIDDIGAQATCTEDGNKPFSYCSRCGKYFMDSEGENEIEGKPVIKAKGHDYKDIVIKATPTKDGKIVPTCSVCGATKAATKIAKASKISISKTKFVYNGKVQKPALTVKDSAGKVIASKYYTVKWSNAKSKAVGKYTVTVTFKGNYSGTKTLTYTIVPKQVTGVKNAAPATKSIKLSWTKVTGAKYYEVYGSTDGKTFKKITTVSTTGAKITKVNGKALAAGKTYYFKVRAMDSTQKLIGEYSKVLKTGTLTAAPKITKLTSAKSKTVTVTWGKVTGAKSYVVYKSTDGKKWTKVASTTKTTCTLTKLTGGKPIYVKVLAVNAYKANSDYSAVKSVTVKK